MVVVYNSFCFMMKVDKNSTWARWTHASSLNQEVDVEDIPSEASRKFDDSDGKVAVVEEVLYSLLSPFHEVRLASVSCVAGLLSGQHHSGLWQQTMFARLTAVLWNLFIVKVMRFSCFCIILSLKHHMLLTKLYVKTLFILCFFFYFLLI